MVVENLKRTVLVQEVASVSTYGKEGLYRRLYEFNLHDIMDACPRVDPEQAQVEIEISLIQILVLVLT